MGIVQALLITKHMLFLGFSLSDDAFNQVGMTVRKALDPEAARQPGSFNSTSPDGLWNSAYDFVESYGQVPHTGRQGTACVRTQESPRTDIFGTALTLSDRPFLSELWPDLDCCPMRPSVADTEAKQMARSRQLEVFLDYVCFKTSNTAEHLYVAK